MNDNGKTKEQLIQELEDLRRSAEGERSLPESEERFKTLFEKSTDAQILIDHEGKVVDCNDAHVELLGLRGKSEVLGHLPVDFAPEFQLNGTPSSEMGNKILTTILERGSARFEWAHQKHDPARTPIMTELSCTLIHISNRPMIHVAIRDITERKQAEVALRESEERLSSIYNTTGDVIFLLDVEPDGEYRFNTVNPAFLTTTGLPTERVVGKSVKEVIPEPSLTLVLSKYRQAVQEKTIVRWEETSDYPTGKLSALITIAPILDADGICQHLVGNVHDITDRKRTKQSLREIEERHRIILQTSMDGFWMVDMQGNLLEVNETYCRMSGYSAQELLTMSILDLEVSESTDEITAHVRKVMVQGEDRFETRHRRKDGSIFDVEVSVQYRPTDIGLFVAFLRDITERKQMEEELRKSRDELEVRVQERTAELTQSKKQLRILASQILTAQEDERKRIALEVHDVLGSSLSAIKFKAEEALQRLPQNGTLNILISKPLEALIPLVHDTIEEARRIQVNLRPPLLDDLGIVTTLSWFCRRFETIYSNVKVEQAITIREEEVADHLKIILFRITQEAMNNIGKYAKADSVYLGLQKIDNSAIELCIKDNGEGFDPESLSSRERSKKGLGLSSMKERVESSGGSFSIESAKGKGTVMRAVWPV
jgi:PAS domain S-box-containing protein